jgi:hypothetical protein
MRLFVQTQYIYWRRCIANYCLLHSSGLWMNECVILEKVSTQHFGWSDYMVTGCNKHNFIFQTFLRRGPTPLLFFSHTSGCWIESLYFFTVNILSWVWVGVRVFATMSQPSKRLRPAKYLNCFLTLIAVKFQYQATSVQLTGVWRVCQGCHIFKLTAKQPRCETCLKF